MVMRNPHAWVIGELGFDGSVRTKGNDMGVGPRLILFLGIGNPMPPASWTAMSRIESPVQDFPGEHQCLLYMATAITAKEEVVRTHYSQTFPVLKSLIALQTT